MSATQPLSRKGYEQPTPQVGDRTVWLGDSPKSLSARLGIAVAVLRFVALRLL